MDKNSKPNVSPVSELCQLGAGNNCNVTLRYAPVAPAPAYWVLLIQLDGTGKYVLNNEAFMLEKAEACLLRPTDSFLQPAKGGSVLSFLVDVDFLYSLSALVDIKLYSDLTGSTGPLRFALSQSLLSSVLKKTADAQVEEADHSKFSRLCMLQFQELYIQFLTQYSNSAPQYPQWLTNLIVTLQDSSLFGVPMSQIAATTPYSYSRLSRLFIHYTGVSLIDYVTDVKIRYAKQLLKNTDMTMLAIASKLEFSVSYFNKLFKRKVGITPGEYRKSQNRP